MLYALICILVLIIILNILGRELVLIILGIFLIVIIGITLHFASDETILDIIYLISGVGFIWAIRHIVKERNEKKKQKELDELYEEAEERALENGVISSAVLCRKLDIEKDLADRLINELERKGVIGPDYGGKWRKVL